mgnify:CR=1 FL=1
MKNAEMLESLKMAQDFLTTEQAGMAIIHLEDFHPSKMVLDEFVDEFPGLIDDDEIHTIENMPTGFWFSLNSGINIKRVY